LFSRQQILPDTNADADIHTLSNTGYRPNVHSLSDVYALAYANPGTDSHPYARPNTDVDADTDADIHALSNTGYRPNVHSLSDVYALAYSNSGTDSHAETRPNTDANTGAYGYFYPDAYSDCYTNAGPANTTAWIDGYADACSYSYSCTDTYAHSGPDTDPDTDPHTYTYARAHTHVDPGTYHDTDANASQRFRCSGTVIGVGGSHHG
jgi:hypothetical protein